MNTTFRKTSLALIAGVSTLGLTSAALAVPAVGLVDDRTLIWFDTETGEVSNTVEVEGVDMLLGIDYRPADGMLYSVDGDGMIVTIDLESGQATQGAELSETYPQGETASFNFNPVADRLRLMAADGTNFRIDVDSGDVTVDGELAYEDGDDNAGAEPNVVTTAYTNQIAGTEETAMYDIDASLGAFLRQTAPNDGTLATIGMLGVDADHYAFTFETRGMNDNVAWMVANGGIYTIDVETGEAVMTGELQGVDGTVRDIAIEPASM